MRAASGIAVGERVEEGREGKRRRSKGLA